MLVSPERSANSPGFGVTPNITTPSEKMINMTALVRKMSDPSVTDAKCASFVRFIEGDINESGVALTTALRFKRELTIAALARRPDIDPTVPDGSGVSALWYAASYGRGLLEILLREFPRLDVNRPMSMARPQDPWNAKDSIRALHLAATAGNAAEVDLLLAAGANPFEMTGDWLNKPAAAGLARIAGHLAVAAAIDRHAAWLTGCRSKWMSACVAIGQDRAEPVAMRHSRSRVGGFDMACILADDTHVCLSVCDYALTSEYASMIALFL